MKTTTTVTEDTDPIDKGPRYSAVRDIVAAFLDDLDDDPCIQEYTAIDVITVVPQYGRVEQMIIRRRKI
jgi:hypothetical protein